MLAHKHTHGRIPHERTQLVWDKDFQVLAIIGIDLIHQSACGSEYCLQRAEPSFFGTVKITVATDGK